MSRIGDLLDLLIAAPCTDRPIDDFFPNRGGSLAEAKQACEACRVSDRGVRQQACSELMDILEGPLTRDRLHGFAAGMSVEERIARRRERQAA